MLVELAAIIWFRSGILPLESRDLAARYGEVTYYATRDWSELFWRESERAESYRYEPHTGWRHRAFQGTIIQIDDRGVRQTPGCQSGADVLKVFTFGGSTMWGWTLLTGAPSLPTCRLA